MGNCISVDLGLNDLLICCANRATEEVMYIWDFKDNLEALKSSRDKLNASMKDLNQHLKNQEGPQMKRLHTVDLWLTSVKEELTQADKLSSQGEAEIAEKSCCCYYKNSISTYSLGKSIVDSKNRLDELQSESERFDSLVESVSVEPHYIYGLKRDLRELETARNDLEAAMKDLIGRVKKEEGGKMKQLEQVRVWISEAGTLIAKVDQQLMQGPQEIEKLQVKDFSNGGFWKTIAETLEEVKRHREKGNFPQVVESVESEYNRKLEDNVSELKRYRRELSGLCGDVMKKVELEEEREGKIRLKQAEVWWESVANTIAEADQLLSPHEIEKLSKGCCSNSFGENVDKTLKDVVNQLEKGQFTEVTVEALPEPVVEISHDHIGEMEGLQSSLDEAWRVLMEPEFEVLGLYGLGGVGKTTRLTHINNKFLIPLMISIL